MRLKVSGHLGVLAILSDRCIVHQVGPPKIQQLGLCEECFSGDVECSIDIMMPRLVEMIRAKIEVPWKHTLEELFTSFSCAGTFVRIAGKVLLQGVVCDTWDLQCGCD